jgi:protein SCO1
VLACRSMATGAGFHGRRRWRGRAAVAAAWLALAGCREAPAPAQAPATAQAPAAAQAAAPGPEQVEPATRLSVPDLAFVDQRGQPVRLRELLDGKTVAMSFIFTRCTTICPPLGMGFGKLRELLGERAGRDVALVTVSLDPEHDTPERLEAWARRYGQGPGWTLLTGSRADVDALLKAMGVYTPAKEQHAPIVLVGNGGTGEWSRVPGLVGPKDVLAAVDRMAARLPRPAGAGDSPAHRYFGDTPLVDQEGRTLRFYSDLLRDKVVVINVFFAGCASSCPVTARNLVKIQDELGDRLGKDVNLISISVDPKDVPERLNAYAKRMKARPGWYFLTGDKADVDRVTGVLGLKAATPDDHSSVMLIGNDRTGLWKKAFGMSAPGALSKVVFSVVNDRGEPATVQ